MPTDPLTFVEVRPDPITTDPELEPVPVLRFKMPEVFDGAAPVPTETAPDADFELEDPMKAEPEDAAPEPDSMMMDPPVRVALAPA